MSAPASSELALECWCGGGALEPYSDDYSVCTRCRTLVTRHRPGDDLRHVQDERGDRYGASYFFERALAREHPDLRERAHRDLPERCAHWLKALASYRPPPAATLEIGCSSGAFVGLLASSGYDAAGLDLSPEVTDMARRAFSVPVLTGPLEEQDLPEASLDVVILMDVLEHLLDPLRTLGHAARALRADGLLLVQTPGFDPSLSHADLAASNHSFLAQMQPDHLFLYSRDSAAELMRRLGFAHLGFLPAFFPMYDMFFVASRSPLAPLEETAWRTALRRTRGGRIAEALVDAHDAARDRQALQERLDQVELDRARRLELILQLQGELAAMRKELAESRAELARGPWRRALRKWRRRWLAARPASGGKAP